MASVKMIAMEGSSSEESYAQNSLIQNRNFHAVAKPALAKAVQQLLCNLAARRGESAQGGRHIAIADLGCSYGRNTLECAEFIVAALHQNWAAGEKENNDMPEIQYFFSDLPSNDFNALFQSLQPYLHRPPAQPNDAHAAAQRMDFPRIYAAGVPGSFHGRLFPTASLDLVICSYSLHWLSQVPPSLLDKSSPSWNGGHAWIVNSSQNVLDAYALQSKVDMVNFLKSRTEELASGGILFLLHMARSSISKSKSLSTSPSPFELFDCAWKEMVNEGIITMDEFDMFNMPMHLFDEDELRNMLKDIPEFKILHMETVESKAYKQSFTAETWLNVITSTTKPMVEMHLGEQKSRELYKKLKEIGCKLNVFSPGLSHNLLITYLQRL